MEHYTIDKRRVIVHGMGIGGQMGFYLGFHLRDLLRGVATTGAALANQPKPVVPSQPLSFFIATGAKDPIAPDVREGKTKLEQLKYPVIYREVAEMAHQYLSDPAAEETMDELLRWIDSIDRL
jgi:predicted esterase